MDYLYLNSMFSPRFTLLPLLLGHFGKLPIKVVLAPRGMLHQGALQYKSFKKQLLLQLFKHLGIYQRVYFHATDPQEKADIVRQLGVSEERTIVIPNIPQGPAAELVPRNKKPGQLRLVFISRVAPKKNLDFFLRLLHEYSISGQLELAVYGNIEEGYWETCLTIIKKLPDHISVEYHGSLRPAQVTESLESHHFFLLPTHGENFGHAIFEAFATGTPVLISDQTPWRDLAQQRIGWDLPLSDEVAWVDAIQQAIDMDQDTYRQWSRSAHAFAKKYLEEQDLVGRYMELFEEN